MYASQWEEGNKDVAFCPDYKLFDALVVVEKEELQEECPCHQVSKNNACDHGYWTAWGRGLYLIKSDLPRFLKNGRLDAFS